MPSEAIDLTIDQAVPFGIKLLEKGHIDEAESVFRNVLIHEPSHFETLVQLTNTLILKGEYYEALYRIDRALMMDRQHGWAISNKGLILGELGHHQEALDFLERAVKKLPESPSVWNNLGNLFISMDRYQEAIQAMDRCLRLDPGHVLSHYNRGIAFVRLGKVDDAIRDLRAALRIDPDHADARFNLGIAQLLKGNYLDGFRNYEARWNTAFYENVNYAKAFAQYKPWNGESLMGKKILIYGDQGFGDAIMFSRYFPLLVAAGAEVVCNIHTPLMEMFQASFPAIEVLEPGDPLAPDIEYRCALPSLPRAFGTTIETIPAPAAMDCDGVSEEYWRRQINFPGLKVGVCWSGNFQHANDASRSIRYKTFAKLFGDSPISADVKFYSLQKDVRLEDMEDFTADPRPERVMLQSWSDTAAAVKALDLVISCDTSVAHIAATQGVPTWILIAEPRVDWRWMQGRADSPWYPSVQLFRQSRSGDWAEVIRRVAANLKAPNLRVVA